MIRKFDENWLKGVGILSFGDRRELINLSWSKHGFNRDPEFGFTGHISNDSGLFLGITIWTVSFWLQVAGRTLDYVEDGE